MGRDHQSRLFASGDGSVLRAILPQYSAFFEELLGNPCIRKATDDRLLIPAGRAMEQIDGYGLVIRHPRLRFITYPYEWTPSMFKAAALCILKLNLLLMENGLCLMDAHPWNICFDGTNPVFVDFSSIIKLPPEGKWEQARDFEIACLQPLEIMAKGYPSLARLMVRNSIEPFRERIVPAVLAHPARRGKGIMGRLLSMGDFISERIARRADRRVRHNDRSATAAELRRMQQKIEKLNVEPIPGDWATYYPGRDEAQKYPATRGEFAAVLQTTSKPAIVDQLIARHSPASVLDIGCNRGLYSQIAALHGAKVVGVDFDESVLDQMYRDSCRLGTGALPLLANPVVPVEAIGPAHRPLPALSERLQSDCVMALAVVHHIVFGPTNMSFDDVAALLASYTRDMALIEFVPREDPIVAKWLEKRTPEFAARYEFYSAENFRKALVRHFSSIEQHESHPATRIMFFCRKNEA